MQLTHRHTNGHEYVSVRRVAWVAAGAAAITAVAWFASYAVRAVDLQQQSATAARTMPAASHDPPRVAEFGLVSPAAAAEPRMGYFPAQFGAVQGESYEHPPQF